MMAWPRQAGAAFLALMVAGALPSLGVQDPEPADASAGAPEPQPSPSPTPFPGRPISESVDRAVDRFVREHFSACGPADESNVPCFPITVEARGRRYSVAESLGVLEFDSKTSPSRPPTVDETAPFRPGPQSAYGNVAAFDPVCAAKSLAKKLVGKTRTYYLYRVWDQAGERPVLRERPLEASEFEGVPQFRYVLLGKFGDECAAIKAYRKALREAAAREESEP